MKLSLTIKSVLLTTLVTAMSSFAQDGADPKNAGKKAYPANWGKPPQMQTDDYRQLPGGYGMGSGTLAKWIAKNIEADKKNPVKALDASVKGCKKNVVSASLGGPTPTGIYYTFSDQKAVLVVKIDNKNKDFPVSAKLHVFDDNATQKGLSGWVNNQHSCALYPGVPNPVKTHQIPAASCKVTSHKLIDTNVVRQTEFENYTVEFQLKDVPVLDGIKVKDLTGKAKVHVKKD
jgi:hypothetical protein